MRGFRVGRAVVSQRTGPSFSVAPKATRRAPDRSRSQTSPCPGARRARLRGRARLRDAGADAQITEYAGAYHAFDRPAAGPPRRSPGEQNASHCFWEERPEGQLVNRDSGQPFSLGDPCVVLGGTFGPDPVAFREALRAVKVLVGTGTRPSP
jgi:dienelactone hydrolase